MCAPLDIYARHHITLWHWNFTSLNQETLKEYEAAANIDMDSRSIQQTSLCIFYIKRTNLWKAFSVKMEFGELKAEAYSSLSTKN